MEFVVSLVSGLSVGTWIYSRMLRKTGNNVKSSLTVAAISGLGAFLVIYLLALTFLRK